MKKRSPKQLSALRRALARCVFNSLFASAIVCSYSVASAQSIFREVDDAGRPHFSDRPEVAVPVMRSAEAAGVAQEQAAAAGAPAPAQTPVVSGRPVRTGPVDRKEADRRLRQAERELARGIHRYRGEPPLADGAPGERLAKLRRNVAAAQARVDELNAKAAVASGTTSKPPKSMVLAGSQTEARSP